MLALTVWQPYASLLITGSKWFETRSWSPPKSAIGQRVAIHAAKRPTERLEHEGLVLEMAHDFTAAYPDPMKLPLGAVLGTGILKRVISTNDKELLYTDVPHLDFLVGDFSPDRFAWEFSEVLMFEKPIPARGMQGLWHWEPPQ